MSNKIDKLAGTSVASFNIDAVSASALKLKNSSGTLQVRNKADTAFASASVLNLIVNDGGTHKTTISQPTLSADMNFALPATAGSAGQVLSTDGAGTLSWVSAASTAACVTEDTTSLAFGTTSPLALFTLPANAVIRDVRIIVDTAFNGTPTLSIGISGTTSKYAGTGDIDLTTAGEYCISPGLASVGTTEALIATYSAGSASAGAARIIVGYSVPQ